MCNGGGGGGGETRSLRGMDIMLYPYPSEEGGKTLKIGYDISPMKCQPMRKRTNTFSVYSPVLEQKGHFLKCLTLPNLGGGLVP